MNRNVDKIIEMALDFGEFEVNDPHDPEFHKTMAGERVVVYYGTTITHFWEVIKNGIHAGPTIRRAKGQHNAVTFDVAEARDNAHRMAYLENNEQHNGPSKPLVFVAETKIQKPSKAGASDMDQFIAGTSIGAETNTVLPIVIHPREITGVFYPVERSSNAWEVPVKKFIRNVQAGMYPEIQNDQEFKRGAYRPHTATKEGWQITVLRYIQDMLNYSSNYFHYLTGEQGKLAQTVIQNATKMGIGKMWHWTGPQFMEWIYTILPPLSDDHTKEEDLAQIMNNGEYNGWNKPFYQLWKKYSDDTTWEYRTGKKTYSPHEE